MVYQQSYGEWDFPHHWMGFSTIENRTSHPRLDGFFYKSESTSKAVKNDRLVVWNMNFIFPYIGNSNPN